MAEKLRHKEHHFSCPKTQAWDIDNVPCSCPRGWPRTPYAMPLPADVAAQEIAALRAKLEQAEARVRELESLTGEGSHLCHPHGTMDSSGGGICEHCGRTLHELPEYADEVDRLQQRVRELEQDTHEDD